MVKASLFDLVRKDIRKENLFYDISEREETKIGRDKDNDIVVGALDSFDPKERLDGGIGGMINTVSRNHCVVYNKEGGLSVEDYKSRNGTLVNKMSIPPYSPMPLKNGDVLMLGIYSFEVKIEE